jgi:hypothetical protein
MELIFEADIVLSDKFAAIKSHIWLSHVTFVFGGEAARWRQKKRFCKEASVHFVSGSFRSRSNPIVQFSIFMVEIISLLPVKV